MNSVNIKIIDKNFSNNDIKIVKEGEFSYTNETTFLDVLNHFEIEDIMLDEKNAIVKSRDRNNQLLTCVQYIIQNGQVQWLIPLDVCSFKDYLHTYCIQNEVILYTPQPVGGTGCDFWVFILQHIDTIIALIEGSEKLFTYSEKLKKQIENKFLLNKNGIVTFEIVNKFIKCENYYALSAFKYKMNLKEDEELAIMLLGLAGYIYQKEDDLYFYNESKDKENQEVLRKLINENLDKFGNLL